MGKEEEEEGEDGGRIMKACTRVRSRTNARIGSSITKVKLVLVALLGDMAAGLGEEGGGKKEEQNKPRIVCDECVCVWHCLSCVM